MRAEPAPVQFTLGPPDEAFFPPEDECADGAERGYRCGEPASAHVSYADWSKGLTDMQAPTHKFVPPAPKPRPEWSAEAHWTTEWTCSRCGADCDVWGVAGGEWMECVACGGWTFVG